MSKKLRLKLLTGLISEVGLNKPDNKPEVIRRELALDRLM